MHFCHILYHPKHIVYINLSLTLDSAEGFGESCLFESVGNMNLPMLVPPHFFYRAMEKSHLSENTFLHKD